MLDYFIHLGDATSQWFNTLFGGHPNESISGRAYREKKWYEKYINFLLWFDKDHCKTAYDNDVSYAAKLLGQHRATK